MHDLTPAPPLWVVPETADAELLARPLRSLADIEAIEQTPLDDRLSVVDFYRRIDLALLARNPHDPAIHFVADGDPDGPVEVATFAELRRNIARVAALLRTRGIGRTDAVAVVLPTIPAAYWSLVGALSRAIAFPINWMLEAEHMRDLILESRAKAVIALGPTPGFSIWETLASIRSELPGDLPVWSVAAPGGEILPDSDLALVLERQEEDVSLGRASGDDVAAYIHSGGTTGRPKIVRVSHRNMSYRHFTVQLAMQVEVGEVIPQDTPIFHVGGLAGRCLPSLACGASLMIPSIMGARDKRYLANYWRFVERFGVTRLSGVPTMFSVLAKTPPKGEDLSSLKPNFISGSTALPVAVRREFERVSGVRILNSYGLTENTATVAVELRDGEGAEGASGVRVPYTQVRAAVLGADGDTAVRLCGEGEIGMLQVKGPGLALGYLSDEHTAASRTPDGWLITGDLGRIDADGNVFVTGRAKDVIIRGGHNIDPGPIEEALLQCPEVLYAAAVGKPDAYAGELPVAYVQLAPGAGVTAEALIALAARRISERPAVPKEIFVLARLPLTTVGKPLKTELRRDAAERAFRAALATIPDLAVAGHEPDVAVKPHPVHGALVAITLSPGTRDGSSLRQQIAAVMDRYAFAYEVCGDVSAP
jgi:fatty-acyl-CoA synthase